MGSWPAQMCATQGFSRTYPASRTPYKPPFRRRKSCEVRCDRALLWNALSVARRALGAPVAGKDPTSTMQRQSKLCHLFSVFSLLNLCRAWAWERFLGCCYYLDVIWGRA